MKVEELKADDLRLADRWILSRLARVVRETTEHMEAFRLNDAVGTPYHFLWDDFADWYLEEIKPRLWGDEPGGDVARAVAVCCFDATLRLLHPVLPYITETLGRRLPGRADSTMMKGPRPGAGAGRDDGDAERDFAFVQAVVNAVRAIRADYGVKPGQSVTVSLSRLEAPQRAALAHADAMVKRLAKIERLVDSAGAQETPTAGAHAMLPDGAGLFVELGDAIDVPKECSRLGGELARLEKQLAGLRTKLANESFIAKAPADVVARERQKENEWSEKCEALAGKLKALGCG